MEKGIANTGKLLEDVADPETDAKTGKDPFGWAKTFKAYKKEYGPRIGGTKFDITRMSRAERAEYAFDKEDPLKDVSEKDLKEGNLDFA